MALMPGDSFFGGNKTDSRLCSATVWNVTQSSLTSSIPHCGADRTLILGSKFSYVSNGIDGTIVRRFCHTTRFLAQNTTFLNGLYEEMKFKTPQLLSDISNTFIKCVFNCCTSSSNGGSLSASYTVLPSSIDLTLKDCIFESSKSDQNGGAIAVILDGSNTEECRLTVDIETCHFSNTIARTGEGGSIFFNVHGDSECNGSFKIHNLSEFSDCNSNVGGCIRSSISSKQQISFLLDNCIILSSTAETGGGIAHEVLLSSKSSFTIENSYIYGCYSSCGGSLLFFIHEYLAISIARTQFLFSTSTRS
ncbi:hypothetical protein BLNAU_16323 [Blattamonas nauphoetae]|uniref:Uncharacterized protein n=1 Tax=Blattamonas nauphoetae TaxID=2049346 RepID=A0ABQ9X8F1_9EUKA|nr:hypothetical protein BLNAU_16323 [Blattamonas nauphoetae]